MAASIYKPTSGLNVKGKRFESVLTSSAHFLVHNCSYSQLVISFCGFVVVFLI